MAKHATADLRNVALVGHADAGKTSLADALLAKAGAVGRQGSVKDKTSVFDAESDEKERGHSIDNGVAFCSWKGTEINLIDCPGYPDFLGQVASGLSAADLALVCVNASAGVQVNTRRVWKMAVENKVPRAIVVTKVDLVEGGSGKRTELLENIRSIFGDRCVPWRAGDSISGDYTTEWTEAVVEADDELMMRYLDGEEITGDDRKGAARAAIAKGTAVPVIFVSAESGDGVEHLLDFINERGPSPADVPVGVRPKGSDDEVEWEKTVPSADGDFLATVWKVTMDKHVGKIAHLKILNGTAKSGDHFVDTKTQKKERFGHIHRMMGRDQKEIEQAVAGDLIVVTKIDGLHRRDALNADGAEIELDLVSDPSPMYSLAITAKNRGEEGKIAESLNRLVEETPGFTYHREVSTHEAIISGMSQLHLDVMLKRLKERYGFEVETSRPKVPYKEAVTAAADGHYRHKKQSGGRGQFAEVFLKVERGEAGKGLEYSWDIFGGAIPTNFSPAIEKGIREKMESGIIAGYPMENVKVSITDGKFHDVDSSEAAFKMAGGRAFSDAVAKARAVLLEPLVKVEILIPGDYMGDVSGDLNTRRGRIQGMDQVGDYQLIRAEMPQAEVADYSRALTSLTSGEGSYTVEPSHYEQVPSNVQQELIAAFKPKDEDD